MSRSIPQGLMDNRNVVYPVPVAHPSSKWNQNEILILSNLWPNELDHKVIESQLPGRTSKAIECKAKRLGLKRPHPRLIEIVNLRCYLDLIATRNLLEYLENS